MSFLWSLKLYVMPNRLYCESTGFGNRKIDLLDIAPKARNFISQCYSFGWEYKPRSVKASQAYNLPELKERAFLSYKDISKAAMACAAVVQSLRLVGHTVT